MGEATNPIKFFDRYEARARLPVVAFLALPVLPFLWAFDTLLPGSLPGRAVAGLVSIPVLYFLSLVAGLAGKGAERRLWRRWCGPPSIRFCRWKDEGMTRDRKRALHAAVAQHLGIQLHGAQKERARPAEADRQIEDAFKRVRELLRRRDLDGLWSKHLAEYGFGRNALATSTWALGLATISSLGCLLAWRAWGDARFFRAGVGEAILVPILLPLRFWVFPAMARAKAERYAEAAWESFLMIVEAGRDAVEVGTGKLSGGHRDRKRRT
jgi:hypothetical protein